MAREKPERFRATISLVLIAGRTERRSSLIGGRFLLYAQGDAERARGQTARIIGRSACRWRDTILVKLNRVEKMLVNSPIRTWMQRRLADDWFLPGYISLRDRSVLEIGCGRGMGTELLLDRYGARRVIAFDYDPAHVASARRRLQPKFGNRVALFVGDAEWLPFASDQFDVIIELAVFHHLSDWRRALREIARVLKPGGWFFYEEFLRGFVAHPVSRALLAHPRSGWFTAGEFTAALREAGFIIGEMQRRWREWWLAGTARRP